MAKVLATGIGNVTSNPEGLPGAPQAESLVSGVMYYMLLLCLAGTILSAGLWAVGSFSNNYTQSVNGKRGFLICAGAALAIGAALALVTFFFNTGGSVSSDPATAQ